MNILCVGASMALPRDNVLYEHTWFYKLRKNFPEQDFYPDFVRARQSDSLITDRKNDALQFKPDIVILQIGSTECAPRIINNHKFYWKIAINLAAILHKTDLFWKLVKKKFTREPDVVYVPINKFEKNIIAYIKYLTNEYAIKKVFIVKIAKVGTYSASRNPYWNSNIARYNEIYSKMERLFPGLVQCIDPLRDIDDSYYVEDGIHCNEKGNDLVMAMLNDCIQKEIY